ncbi:MAG TPA: metalloregulator ArsR/SmtB family transcription factor [Ornithinibacter sp.]|nr:metalloregulator ArsR/SmtB family transcription factor [Ornithinibacter sp.]
MDVFTAVADPVRRDLLRALSAGSARVVDLAAGRPISRPAVSRHLRVLTDAGLVVADDVGRERHYRARPQGLRPLADFLTDLSPADLSPPVTPDALDALDLEVRRVGRDRRQADDTPDHAHRHPGETA